MSKVALIIWCVVAAICAGFGIAYAVNQVYDVMAVFFVAAVGTVVVGIIRYKRGKDDDKD